jgi:hypothetical protein
MKKSIKTAGRILFQISFYLVFNFSIFSQTIDLEEIKYSSSYEKAFFQNFNSSSSLLKSMLAMSSTMTEEQEAQIYDDLIAFIETIRPKIKGSDKKIIDFIQLKTHEQYLKKYKEISPFANIFKSGEYNCVSSTALFAFILGELDIPYEIKKKPGHVYLVAYPKTSLIILESTLPVDGNFQLNERQKASAIQYLLATKLITESELEENDVNELIDKYIYKDESVKSIDLASYQYLNSALEFLQKEQIEKAYEAICKAEIINQTQIIKLLKFQVVTLLVANSEFKTMDDFHYLKEFSKIEGTKNEVLHYIEIAITDRLIKKNDPSYADSIVNYFIKDLTDTSMINEVRLVYYFKLGYYYQNNSSKQKAFDTALKAYKINSDNVLIHTLVVESIRELYKNKDSDEELINKLEGLIIEMPFLKTHNSFQSFLLENYAIYMQETYEEDNKSTKPLKFFPRFEEILKNLEDFSSINEKGVGFIFAEIGSYYYREKNYKKALEILELGLKYFPKHERILVRIDIVKNALQKN